MAQILNLTKLYSSQEMEEAATSNDSFEEVEAGAYVCKIVDAILNLNDNENKRNIQLQLDIAEGEHKGFFQRLEDRAGFWGLNGYMSFKKDQVNRFSKTCTSINNSNPGYSFNPMNGDADVDSLKGKMIGVIIGREEYMSKSGDIREKCYVFQFLEVNKARNCKAKIPELKKLEKNDGFMKIPEGTMESIPFN